MPAGISRMSELHGINGGPRPWTSGGGYGHLHLFHRGASQFLPLIERLFREVDEGRMELVTSALTLLEVLVVPYRQEDHLLGGPL